MHVQSSYLVFTSGTTCVHHPRFQEFVHYSSPYSKRLQPSPILIISGQTQAGNARSLTNVHPLHGGDEAHGKSPPHFVRPSPSTPLSRTRRRVQQWIPHHSVGKTMREDSPGRWLTEVTVAAAVVVLEDTASSTPPPSRCCWASC